MKSFRVVVTLLAISFLLPSMAASNYEKAVYHQNKAEQAYKYSLVSMMKAHIDSMWQEIYEMDWDAYDKNRERLDRGYYKLCGDYYYLTDTLDRALYYYNLAQPLFKRYEGVGYYGIIHEEKAQLFYKMKEWEKAKSYADTLKSLYNDTLGFKDADKAFYWSAISDLCQAREAVDDYRNGYTTEAERKFKNSLTDINTCLRILSPSDGELYYDVLRTRAKILMLKSEQDGAYNDQARKDFKAYFDRKKAQISGTLLGMTEEQREQFWMQERRFITDCYRLEGHAPELLYDVTLYAKGILLHLGKNGTENYEKLSFVTYKDVQKSLPSKSCAIEFVQYERDGEQHLSALVLKQKGNPEFVHIGKVDDILSTHVAVTGERQDYYQGYVQVDTTLTVKEILDFNNSEKYDKDSRFKIFLDEYENKSILHPFIYEDSLWRNLVWTPQLMSRIKDFERVYFAPEGFLRAIAVEYVLPSGYEYLDLYRLSSTHVLATPKARVNPSALYQGNALILSIGDFGEKYCLIPDKKQGPGDNDWRAYDFLHSKGIWFKPLSGVERECEAIERVRNNNEDVLLKDQEATETKFRQLSSKYPIIHFSTHGFSFSYEPIDNDLKPDLVDNLLSRCGIAMANINCNLYNFSSFDHLYYEGLMSAREFSKCDLSNAELVVTSACVTAVGSISSDGNYAVERGLKAAGAKAVVVSLWSVSDYSPVYFFERFYSELSQGSSLHKALMNAREYVKNDCGYESPYHYDPFILIDALE